MSDNPNKNQSNEEQLAINKYILYILTLHAASRPTPLPTNITMQQFLALPGISQQAFLKNVKFISCTKLGYKRHSSSTGQLITSSSGYHSYKLLVSLNTRELPFAVYIDELSSPFINCKYKITITCDQFEDAIYHNYINDLNFYRHILDAFFDLETILSCERQLNTDRDHPCGTHQITRYFLPYVTRANILSVTPAKVIDPITADILSVTPADVDLLLNLTNNTSY